MPNHFPLPLGQHRCLKLELVGINRGPIDIRVAESLQMLDVVRWNPLPPVIVAAPGLAPASLPPRLRWLRL
eukprot:8433541-Pyramimonas_sp.AAC.1